MDRSEPGGVTLILHREQEKRYIDIAPGDVVMDLLDDIGMPLDGTLVFSEGSPVPLDMEVEDEMVLTVIRVASGG
ncbi:MAG: hypothetical protein ACMUHM_08845 [Thermoplasmatota archaeon]